jgi:hypothetical protein
MASFDRLSVDLVGLEDFAGNLNRIRAGMHATRAWVKSAEGVLGSRRIDAALDHFESNWSDGRKRVDRNCEGLAGLAGQAVENLRKTDDDLARSLRDAAAPADGG